MVPHWRRFTGKLSKSFRYNFIDLLNVTFIITYHSELDEANAIRTIQQAIRSGINYVDTAPWYGQGKSEEILGRALAGVPREAYYIATKIGRYEKDVSKQMNYTAEKTRESVEKSLKLLGVDYIDVIQVSLSAYSSLINAIT